MRILLAVALGYGAEAMFSGRSGATSGGHTTGESASSGISDLLSSGWKSFQEWRSGPWAPASQDDMIRDFVGYGGATRAADSVSLIMTKQTENKNKWGECTRMDSYVVLDGDPSEATLMTLGQIARISERREIRKRELDAIYARYMNDHHDRALLYAELIEFWDAPVVHKGRWGYQSEIRNERNALADGTDLLRAEEYMCTLGLLRKPFAPLETGDGFCRPGIKGKVVEPEGPTRGLITCLSTQSRELADVDRKLLQDAAQVQRDVARDAGEVFGVTAERTERTSEYIRECERIAVVWTNRVVPWYEYSQGVSSICMYLIGRIGLSPELTLKGLAMLRDQAFRNSRYPAHRNYEYLSWLSHYMQKVLGRRFPSLDRAFGDEDMNVAVRISSLDQFLLRPTTDLVTIGEGFPEAVKAPIWDFIMVNGRPGVFAWMVAAIEHAAACLDKFLEVQKAFNEKDEAERGSWEDELDRLIRTEYPEDAERVHKYDIGDRWEERGYVAAYFISKPVRAFFGPKGVAIALERAQEILTMEFSRTLSKVEANPPKPSRSMLGSKLKPRMDVDQETPVSLVPVSVSFGQLVDMIDELVEAAMEGKSDPVRAEIRTLVRDGMEIKRNIQLAVQEAHSLGVANEEAFKQATGWSEFPHKRWYIDTFILARAQAFVLQSVDCQVIPVEIGMEPSLHALIAAKAAFETEIDHEVVTKPGATVADLAAVIKSLDAHKIVVDGVAKELEARTYESMLAQLRDVEYAKCMDQTLFEFQAMTDLHGCKRVVPDIGHLDFDMYTTPLIQCLHANKEKLNSILAGHLWALVEIKNAISNLALPHDDKRARICSEILSVYALVFTNEPDAIMRGEPAKWCISLQTLEDGALSKEDTLFAISLLANRFTGLNKFGPYHSDLYRKTFTSYWAHALQAHASGIGKLVKDHRDLVGIEKFADVMLGLGYGEDVTPEFWAYMLENGQYGVASVMIAALDKLLLTEAHEADELGDLLTEAKKWIDFKSVHADASRLVDFKQLTNMVNVLVNSAMENNIPLTQ